MGRGEAQSENPQGAQLADGAVDVARSLGVPEVIVPLYPGITSAMGLLTTDLKYDLIKNEFMLSTAPDAARLAADLDALEKQARAQLSKDGVAPKDMIFIRGADCRYVGQGYELRATIPSGKLTAKKIAEIWESFHSIHEAEYGHQFLDNPIELVNLRVVAVGAVPKLKPPKVAGGKSLKDAQVREAELLSARTASLKRTRRSFICAASCPSVKNSKGLQSSCKKTQRRLSRPVPASWSKRTGT